MWQRVHEHLLWVGGNRISIFPELSIRILLIFSVIVMQFYLEPHLSYLTEADIASSFRKPRRDSIVPNWMMVLVLIIVPVFIFSIPMILARNYVDLPQALLAWTLALSINAVITEILKLGTGQPRPDFFYRCFPNGKINKHFKCTGSIKDVIEGRKSFPSGHSSFAFCSMSFVSLWLYRKVEVPRAQCVKYLICFIPLLISSIISASRYVDHHHHVLDIIVGSFIGCCSSYLCYYRYFQYVPNTSSSFYFIVFSSRRVSQ